MGGSPSFAREPLSPEKVVIVTGGNTGRNLGGGGRGEFLPTSRLLSPVFIKRLYTVVYLYKVKIWDIPGKNISPLPAPFPALQRGALLCANKCSIVSKFTH